MLIGIDDSDNVLAINTFNVWLDRNRTESGNDAVRMQALSELRCDLGVHTDLNTRASQQHLLTLDIFFEMSLERNLVLAQQHAAEFIGFFTEDDFMSALCSNKCCFHTSDAATGNKDFLLFLWCRSHEDGTLAAGSRVNGAVVQAKLGTGAVALHAADALVDFVCAAGAGLGWKIRVSQGLTCHLDNICLPLSKKVFHVLRVRERTDSSDKTLDFRLDRCRVFGVQLIFCKHGRV